MSCKYLVGPALVLISVASATAQPNDVIARPGELVVEPPTTGALGFEWQIGRAHV